MYNEIVSKVRNIARDGLRMKIINGERQSLMRYNQEKESIQKNIGDINLELLSIEFEVARLDVADPKKDVKAERFAENKKDLVKMAERATKELACLQEVIDDRNSFIAEVEAGKVKVSAESLQEETNRLNLQ